MREICVVGAGYVGLVTAACFAELGNRVTCVDIDVKRVRTLCRDVLPFYEPGLRDLCQRNQAAERLTFTGDYEEAVRDREFIFIAVNTPSGSDGRAVLMSLRSAARNIAENTNGHTIVVNKSTVPVGTGYLMEALISRHKQNSNDFAVVSNPEFLREGSAVSDFLHPARVVLGSRDMDAARAVAQLYEPLHCPILFCDTATAEMIKYASNAFLATKISFINEIASMCEKMEVDVKDVARGMGLDERIGPAFLEAGVGWGGSCFAKDIKALSYMARAKGVSSPLLQAVTRINRGQRGAVVRKLSNMLGNLEGRNIGILGLSFKPNTDDVREAPSLEIIQLLQQKGCHIKVYDPVAMDGASKVLFGVTFCADAYEVAVDSDALVLVTEWEEFKELEMRRIRSLMRRPFFIDGRNLYHPQEMIEAGFIYEGMGRGTFPYAATRNSWDRSKKRASAPSEASRPEARRITAIKPLLDGRSL